MEHKSHLEQIMILQERMADLDMAVLLTLVIARVDHLLPAEVVVGILVVAQEPLSQEALLVLAAEDLVI